MTKDEIKFYKEQQRKVEDGYIAQIKLLEMELADREASIKKQDRTINDLRDQIALLQDGLTGDEMDFRQPLR